MKKKLFSVAVVAVCSMMVMMSCSKDEPIEPQKMQVTRTANASIPYFQTLDEAIDLANKLSEQTLEERQATEQEYGYFSIGSISDEFYNNIDFESFQSEDAFLDFYDSNKWLLDTTYVDGELCVDSKFNTNIFRNIANQDGYLYIGDTIVRIFKDMAIATHVENEKLLYEVNENDIKGDLGFLIFNYNAIEVVKDLILEGKEEFMTHDNPEERLWARFHIYRELYGGIHDSKRVMTKMKIKAQHKYLIGWCRKKKDIMYSLDLVYHAKTSRDGWTDHSYTINCRTETARVINIPLFNANVYDGDISISSINFYMSNPETGGFSVQL